MNMGPSASVLEAIANSRPPGATLAEEFYECIRGEIRASEADAKEGEQALWTVACMNGREYPVLKVGYSNPTLIRFQLLEPDGRTSRLLMHVAAVQMFRKTIKLQPKEEKRRIGFENAEVTDLTVQQSGEATYDPNAQPIWEIALEIGAAVPAEEWAAVPSDLSKNLDFHLYGTPRDEK